MKPKHKFLYFPGCKINYHQPSYGETTKLICQKLGIELVEVDFQCCGYPIRHQDFDSFIYTAAKNLALAKEMKMDIITPCKCCYGSFKHAIFYLNSDSGLMSSVNDLLKSEELWYHQDVKVFHLLTVLCNHIGLPELQKAVTNPLSSHKIAVHYGCHALRPSKIVQFDNPMYPSIFENLITALGATPIDYPRRLLCCGNPLANKNADLAYRFTEEKLQSVIHAGASILTTACTYCQMQFESYLDHKGDQKKDYPILTTPFTQLLCEAMEIESTQ